jgi:hypothetical protein
MWKRPLGGGTTARVVVVPPRIDDSATSTKPQKAAFLPTRASRAAVQCATNQTAQGGGRALTARPRRSARSSQIWPAMSVTHHNEHGRIYIFFIKIKNAAAAWLRRCSARQIRPRTS